MPFRFGTEIEMENELKSFKYNLSLDIYSDPYFLRDFNDREEKTNWSEVLGLDEEDTDDDDDDTSIMDRLWWYFHGSYTESDKLLGGLITDINITKIDFSLNWKNKKQDTEGFEGIDSAVDGYIPYSARTDYFFPEQYFYYPEYYIFPDFSFTVKGTIFSHTFKTPPMELGYEKTDDPDDAMELVSPWPKAMDLKEEQNRSIKDNKYSEVLEYERMKDETVKTYKKRMFFNHEMTYNISPSIAMTKTLDYSEWEKPEEVSFDKAYTALRTYGTAGILYSADLYDDVINFDNNIVLTGDYRSHYDRSENITDASWDSYKLQDYKASYYKLENKMLIKVYPLYKYELYSQSFASYQADTIILKKEYDFLDNNGNPVYEDSFFRFRKEYFTEHEADFNLKYLSSWNQIQHFRIRTVLPPLLQEIENVDIVRTGPLTSTIIFEINETEEDRWSPDDFTWKEKLTYDDKTYIEHILIYSGYNNEWDSSESIGRISFFYDEVNFKQTFLYGYPEESPLEMVSLLNLWFFQMQYAAERMYPMYYEPGYGWMEEDKEKFVPSEFKAKIDFTKYFFPVWKNRLRYKTNISTTWEMDLQEFTENALVFDFGFDLRVHKFLDINFNTKSENNSTYRYIPHYARKMGEEWVNPVTDIIKSFNFFDGGKDRYESFFKLKELGIKAVHHLGDWDLTLEYTGEPNLYQPSSGVPEWRWESETSIMMQWNPIKEIKTEVNITDGEISL